MAAGRGLIPTTRLRTFAKADGSFRRAASLTWSMDTCVCMCGGWGGPGLAPQLNLIAMLDLNSGITTMGSLCKIFNVQELFLQTMAVSTANIISRWNRYTTIKSILQRRVELRFWVSAFGSALRLTTRGSAPFVWVWQEAFAPLSPGLDSTVITCPYSYIMCIFILYTLYDRELSTLAHRHRCTLPHHSFLVPVAEAVAGVEAGRKDHVYGIKGAHPIGGLQWACAMHGTDLWIRATSCCLF
jgi:hypothetical protein